MESITPRTEKEQQQFDTYSWLKFIPIVLFVGSTIVAAVRLEGRVNGHDTLFKERQDAQTSLFQERDRMLVERFDRLNKQYDGIRAQLQRIEDKLDKKKDK